ncbi:MAG: methylated-DNA--[protein]-cysteine S-methyltransferase [Bdellovibrionales bacterium]|nr:methylated-DNA--[protein]-cysteine S-methyltransferase [Bdellovibrionales bacterium]
MFYDEYDSPIGLIGICADESKISSVLFESSMRPICPNDVTAACKSQLVEYYSGSRNEFDLPLSFEGTEFQKQVWAALTRIPYGQTSSYAQQALAIERPKAVRAVGAANGKNKLLIVVPCHRIVGADGSLTGFRGGIERKKWLLDHEAGHHF